MPVGIRAGHPTFWQVFGAGSRPALAIHCSLASSKAWAGVAERLSGRTTLTAFDLPGHGRSAAWPGEGDFLSLSAQIAASFIDRPHELSIPDKDKIFRKAFDELRTRFGERTVPRVGVVHEFVFDTGYVPSLDVVASSLKHDLWRQKAKNLRIFMEAPAEGKNVNIEIRPTYLQRAVRRNEAVPAEDMKYGIIVNVDINNQQIAADLTKAEVNDILVFASDYVPDELIRLLNNEY